MSLNGDDLHQLSLVERKSKLPQDGFRSVAGVADAFFFARHQRDRLPHAGYSRHTSRISEQFRGRGVGDRGFPFLPSLMAAAVDIATTTTMVHSTPKEVAAPKIGAKGYSIHRLRKNAAANHAEVACTECGLSF